MRYAGRLELPVRQSVERASGTPVRRGPSTRSMEADALLEGEASSGTKRPALLISGNELMRPS